MKAERRAPSCRAMHVRSRQPTPGARSEVRYHPSGEIAFPPAQTDPSPRSRGRIGNVNCLTRMAASVPTDEAFEHPDLLQMWQNL